MASFDDFASKLAALAAPAWSEPRDLNRMSLEGLFERGSSARTVRSSGSIRFHGVAISGHSARLDDAAAVLSQLQRLVTATGAARRGVRSSQGPLPGELTTLTQLKIAAAPAGGSLVFDLVPESLPEVELLPGGDVALFDQARRQFVDECLEDALALVSLAHDIDGDAESGTTSGSGTTLEIPASAEAEASARTDNEDIHLTEDETRGTREAAEAAIERAVPADQVADSPGTQSFLQLVLDGGPRLAGAVREFAKAVEAADFDVDLEWREPSQSTKRATFTRHDARVVRQLVVARELEIELRDLEGALITISTTRAWQLAVTPEHIVTVDASKLPAAIASKYHLSERVRIRARSLQRALPGGGTITTFEAIAVESLDVSD